jgi:acyl-CoA thioesterase-1
MSNNRKNPRFRVRSTLRGAAITLCGAVFGAGIGPVGAVARSTEILAFGDSLTSGFGLPLDKALPARLEAKLRADGLAIHVVNGGLAGDTTAGGLARLDWALAQKPDIVILELGANDMLRGIDAAAVRANLETMITKIQASGAKLLLTGMLASPNFGEEYQQEFNRIYPELAEAHNVPLYPFLLDGVARDPQFNQPDGLHPNERGVAVIVDHIAPYVARLIGGS